MLKNLQNSEGVAKKMAKIRMDSTEGSIVQLMSAVEGLAISFGSILTPLVRGMATAMTALTTPMQSFIKNNETLITGVGIFAGVLLASKVVALAYTAAMWLITPAITAMSTALKIAKVGMIAFNFIMSANPIGLLVVGVTALATAGIALYQNWEKVTDTFFKLWEMLKGFNFSDILGSIGKIGDVLGFGDNEINQTATTNIAPALATQAIQSNSVNNIPVAVNVSIVDNKVKGVETTGSTKTDVFLNDGKQF